MEEARLAELLAQARASTGRTCDVEELILSAPWQTELTPHFLFHYFCDVDEDRAFCDTLFADMERLHSEVTDFLPCEQEPSLGAPPDEPRLECFILHTTSPRTFGSLGAEGPLFYLLDPKQDPEYLQKLRHEIVHMLWRRRCGEAPPLFLEGIAVYAEHLSAPQAYIDDLLRHAPSVLADTPPLAEIADTETFWERGSFYTAGGLFVWYLVDRWGWDHLSRLFEISCYHDTSILEHFREVYQIDLSVADIEWRQRLGSL